MSISLQAVQVVHERRVRLLFTTALAGGAFGTPAPAFYVFTNTDGSGPTPGVQTALAVSSSPTVVELTLSQALTEGGTYTVSAVGVPALDSSVTPNPTSLSFAWSTTIVRKDLEPIAKDRSALLYGNDLIWNGTDYQETPLGDLDRVSGPANVTKALNRGVESEGLPWDPNWGAQIRGEVDSPNILSGTVKSRIAQQIALDPRVRAVKMSHEIKGTDTFIYATPTLVTDEDVEPVSISVPNEP